MKNAAYLGLFIFIAILLAEIATYEYIRHRDMIDELKGATR